MTTPSQNSAPATDLIGEKMSRRELEKRLSLRGREATQTIRELRARGLLMAQMDYVDASTSSKRERRYFFVAQTMDLFR